MERTQFVDVDNQGWWFLESELEPALEEQRLALGLCWQWTDPHWYTEPQKLDEVYQFLEANRPDLLRQLDDVLDVYGRQQWLDDLVASKTPAEPEAGQEASPFEEGSEQGAAPAEDTSDSDQPAAAEAQEEPAPKKSSIFAKKAAPVSEPEVEAPAETAPATPADSVAEPAAEPVASGANDSNGEAAEVDDGQLQAISEQVQSVLADMSDGEMASIAEDLGLTVAQVKDLVADPSFASAVAAEQAQSG